MRKLFVLFLLVSLVPFTVGCNGLWDFDDDDDPVASARPTVLVKPAVIVPAAAIAPSIRAQQAWNTYVITDPVTKISYAPVSTTPLYPTTGATSYTLNYEITIDTQNAGYGYSTTTNSVSILFTMTINGNTVPIPVTVNRVSTAAVPVVTPTVTLTDDGSGVITGVVQDDNTTTPVDTPKTYYIKGVNYAGAAVSTNMSAPTLVKSLNPIFNVNFNTTIPANPTTTFTVVVQKVAPTQGSEITLTSDSLFTVTGDTTSMATIKVNGDATHKLVQGATYKVTFKSGIMEGVDIPGLAPFYIKTDATTYPNTTVTVTPTTLTAGTGKVLTMTFTEEVNAAPETGAAVTITKTGVATVTLSSTSSDITLAQQTDKKVVTLTINKEVTAGTYTVAVTNGSWLDKNGNPVEPIKVTFTVN